MFRWSRFLLLLVAFTPLAFSGCGSSEISEEQAIEQEKQEADAQADNAPDVGGDKGKKVRRQRQEEC